MGNELVLEKTQENDRAEARARMRALRASPMHQAKRLVREALARIQAMDQAAADQARDLGVIEMFAVMVGLGRDCEVGVIAEAVGLRDYRMSCDQVKNQ